MSALGQKQTCAVHQPMSALPPIATLIAFFGMSAYHSPQSGHGLSEMVLTFALMVASILFGLFVAALILSAIETAQQCAEE
jgi:cation transporter-like permease